MPRIAIGTTLGTGLTFDGNDYVDIGTLGSFGSGLSTGAFTLTSWVKTIATAVQLITGTANDGTNTSLSLNLNSNEGGTNVSGKYRLFIRDQGGQLVQAATTSATTLNDGSWHHLAAAATPSTGSVQLYFDGAAVATTTGTSGTFSDPNDFQYPLVLGANNNRGTIANFFVGQLDDFRMYSRALVADEVLLLYNKAGASKGLLHHWKLDEGSGTAVIDSTGNSGNGTITGATYVPGTVYTTALRKPIDVLIG